MGSIYEDCAMADDTRDTMMSLDVDILSAITQCHGWSTIFYLNRVHMTIFSTPVVNQFIKLQTNTTGLH